MVNDIDVYVEHKEFGKGEIEDIHFRDSDGEPTLVIRWIDAGFTEQYSSEDPNLDFLPRNIAHNQENEV